MPFAEAIRQLGNLLSKKLDELIAVSRTQKISLDIGESTEKLEKASTNLIQVTSAFQKAADSQNLGNLKQQLAQATAAMATAAREMRDAAVASTARDSAETVEKLTQLVSAVERLDKDPEQLDLSGLSDLAEELRALRIDFTREPDHSATTERLDRMIAILEGQELVVPSTMKLDDNQFRALVGAASSHPPERYATRVTQANVSLTTANTEYSYTFPANTIFWVIKLRAQNAKLFYSWATGKLPGSGDASLYFTVPQNYLHSTDGVDYGGKTIYVESDVASQILEVESWQM